MSTYQGIAGDLPRHADCLHRNGFNQGQAVNRQVLNLAEETGEFVGAYRRWSGQARRIGTAADMHEELADVIITAFVTAHELNVDIEAVIAAKLHKVRTRGWRDTTTCGQPHPRLDVLCDWPAGHQTGWDTHHSAEHGIWWDSRPDHEGDAA
jgi:NTP pyrophosphatase (non-canonical NTP hydrolase)